MYLKKREDDSRNSLRIGTRISGISAKTRKEFCNKWQGNQHLKQLFTLSFPFGDLLQNQSRSLRTGAYQRLPISL
jgi:hypothetical protein